MVIVIFSYFIEMLLILNKTFKRSYAVSSLFVILFLCDYFLFENCLQNSQPFANVNNLPSIAYPSLCNPASNQLNKFVCNCF